MSLNLSRLNLALSTCVLLLGTLTGACSGGGNNGNNSSSNGGGTGTPLDYAAYAAYAAGCSTCCQDDGCGTNSAWLGADIVFHELEVHGALNSAGLRIVGFQDARGTPLGLGIARDVLQGRVAGAVVEVDKLENSILTLFRPSTDKTYLLRISKVGRVPSWVSRGVSVPTYWFDFQETSALGTRDAGVGDWLPVCRPPPQGAEWSGMEGRALIFHGDRYDTVKKTVWEPAAPSSEIWFNIACAGTAIAKLHLLGHTRASVSAAQVTTVQQRQTMLKMITADYCGTGHSFTVSGHPLLFTYNQGWQPALQPLGGKSQPDKLEAIWNEDGAVCLSNPRLEVLDTILRFCQTANPNPKNTIGRCKPTEVNVPDAARNWNLLGYAISANPSP